MRAYSSTRMLARHEGENRGEPLVSVVVPAYNAEKYLRETVESALRQTHRHLEVIIVDDGSRDRTSDIAAGLQAEDARVKYVSQANQGQSAARNLGISRAKGKYVAFLDADDLFLPSKIKEQVFYLEHHPSCGLSYSKIYHFFDGHPDMQYYFRVPHPSGHLFRELLQTNFINPLSVVVRKELLDRYGAFEPTFRRVDEQFLWLKLSFHGVEFSYLDKPLGLYRIHSKSLSNEAQYFVETEETFLRLLFIIRSWMSADQAAQFDFEASIARTKKRLRFGKIMAGKSIFARALHTLYNARRNRKLERINNKEQK